MAEKPAYEELEQRVLELEKEATKHMRAEEGKRESEERFRYLSESSPMGIFQTDKEGSVLYINNKWLDITGMSLQDALGFGWAQALHPEDRQQILAEWGKCLEEKRGYDGEFRFVSPSGEVRWVHTQTSPVFSPAGDVISHVGVNEDITERKQAEEALLKSKNRLQTLIQSIQAAVVVHDSDTRIIQCNQTAQDLLGQTEDLMLGKKATDPDWNFLHEDGSVMPLDEYPVTQVLENRKPLKNFVVGIRRPDKQETTWALVNAVPEFDEKDSVSQVIVTFMDITERKQAEEALRESKEFAENLIAHMMDGFSVLDKNGVHLNVNPAFCKMTGYSQDELIGTTPPHPYWPEEDYENIEKAFQKTMEGEFQDFEMTFKRKNGEQFPVIISPSWVKDIIGDVVSYFATVKDITKRKSFEAQLQQSQKIEAIATLAGGIAHQFNNALSGITGNVDLLEMDFPGDKNITVYVEKMRSSAHRMTQLTSQLLAYARGGKYQAETITINDFIDHTLPIIQPSINPDIRIERDLTTDMLNIETDQTQMQMVLSAILINASEAMEGKGLIRISTKEEDIDEDFLKYHSNLKLGRYVRLTVEDNGKGMDKETRDRIFEPFFTTKFQGRGLGMASAYGIVKNHNGWISIYSEPGRGTVVRIYLPLIEARIKKPIKTTVEPIKGTGTILVIEDEQIVMDISRALLERLGYNVLAAMTGEEAVNIAKTFDGYIDLAILDIILPDMQGGAIYPLIMKARPNLKVIVCSGYSVDGPAQKILDAGAQAFIQKPFTVATLAEKLKEVLDKK